MCSIRDSAENLHHYIKLLAYTLCRNDVTKENHIYFPLVRLDVILLGYVALFDTHECEVRAYNYQIIGSLKFNNLSNLIALI